VRLGSDVAATLGGHVVHRFGRPLVALGQRIVAAAVGIAVIDIASGAPPVRA